MPKLVAKPQPLDLDLARTALVVVDMQNAFAVKGGLIDLAGLDISGAAPVIETNRRLIAAARAANRVGMIPCRASSDDMHGEPVAPSKAPRLLGFRAPRQAGETVRSGSHGGEGGIRTHGTLARTTVFETVPIDHSGTSPGPRL